MISKPNNQPTDNDIDDSTIKKERNILIFKHSDELYIEKASNCFILTVRGKASYWNTIEGSFRALSKALLYEHFGHIPNDEKNDIRKVLRIIEDHDKMIKEMFRGY